MTKRELKELIKQYIKEYTGTGASGGNATDGNDIPVFEGTEKTMILLLLDLLLMKMKN